MLLFIVNVVILAGLGGIIASLFREKDVNTTDVHSVLK